jgi:hypothetical protein
VNLKKLRSYSCVTALLVGACVPASASVVVYTDRITWQSATSSVNTIAFEGIAAANTVVQYDGSPDNLTLGTVKFQGFYNASNSLSLEVNNDIIPNWGTGAVLEGPPHADNTSRIVATVGTGVFAIGSDVMDINGGGSEGGTVNVVLSTGSTVYTVNTIAGFSSHAFVGFVSDTPITSITFFPETPAFDSVVIDNFSTGGQAASPAPEGATMILCGIGLLLMVRLFRRNPSPEAATA